MSRFVFSKCLRQAHEPIVQSNLSVTPSQMSQLAQQGVPVGTQQLQGYFDEGYTPFDNSVPIDKMRGVDIADMWEERQAVKAKVRRAKAIVKPEDE